VFPDVDQCKSAVTHHAILNDHAFEIVKKDKSRFRAICKSAEQGCQWKFFASTSKKYIGCKVSISFVAVFHQKMVLLCLFLSKNDLFVTVLCCRLRLVDQSIPVVQSTSVVKQWPQING
jgi:hypothetical protein